MRLLGLLFALLVISDAPIPAQTDYGAVVRDPSPPTGAVPGDIGHMPGHGREFVSPAQRMLLNYQQFGTRVSKFVSRWEQWAVVRDDIVESPVYDRESFLLEEKHWRGVVKRMNYLIDSRLSKGYLVTAEQLEQKKQTGRADSAPTPALNRRPNVPVAPPTPRQSKKEVSKNLAPGGDQTLREYFAFQREIIEFLLCWVEWQKVHIRLMRADTYNLPVFQREAELWKQVASQVDELKQMRARRAFVVSKAKNP